MFEGSEEAPGSPGIRLLFRDAANVSLPTPRVPHVGWNQIDIARSSRLLEGVKDGSYVYYTHSYFAPVVAQTVATTALRRVLHGDRGAGQQLRGAVSPGKVGRSRIDDAEKLCEAGMLTKRIIACLDVRDGRVVKGVQFRRLARCRFSRRIRAPSVESGGGRNRSPRHHRDLRRSRDVGQNREGDRRGAFHSVHRGGGIRTLEDAYAIFGGRGGQDRGELRRNQTS